MSLSGREVLLILRARDEASRSIYRVSRSMRKLDRDALASSNATIGAQKEQLRTLQRQVGDVNHAYRRSSLEAMDAHRERMRGVHEQYALVRRQVADVNEGYRDFAAEQQRMRGSERITAETYRRNMKQASIQRDAAIRQLRAEREAIDRVSRASVDRYHAETSAARRLHNEQLENLRQQKMQTEDTIRQHDARIRALTEEREMLRMRGIALMNNGAAAMGAGVAMTYMGAMGTAALASTIKANMEYEASARRTLTQTDGIGASLRDIERIGKQVADTLPVAFEEIQPALYDIFSSIDVGLRGGTKLVKQFARDAVGGTTEMSVATRANLAIMNAWKLGVDDAADVSDFMFQLVRKGVGTYDEFAKAIGRAIPSAKRAGQSYQTLGAMMAFLTRNGLSTAMAATSSARALDALSHPSTVQKMKDIGIEVRNAQGEFKPLQVILEDMNKEFGDMTSPQRAKALYELFKGSGGTIQARRFFDNYFKNVDEFNQRTKEMKDAAGAADEAFRTMADSPTAKIQQLKNDWMLFRIELGEHLLPTAMKVIDGLNKFLDWYDSLDSGTKKAIAHILAFTAVFTALMGVLLTFGGAVMVFAGAANAIGMSARGAAGKVSLLTAGLGLVATAIYDARNATTGAEQDFAAVKGALGGMIAGSAFGPWGAAIGTAAGFVGTLAAQSDLAAQKQEELAAAAKRVTETLNEQTGAFTKRTREQLVSDMGDEGMLSTAVKLRQNLPAMTEAIMQGTEGVEKFRTAGWKTLPATKSATAEFVDLTNKMYDMAAALQGGQRGWMLHREAMGKTGAKIQVTREQTQKLSQTYDLLPKDITTIVKAMKVDDSKRSVNELAKKYKLMPRDVRTIFKAMGTKTIKKEVDEVKAKVKSMEKVRPNMNPLKALMSGALKDVKKTGSNEANATRRVIEGNLKKTKPQLDGAISGLKKQLKTGEQNAAAGARQIVKAIEEPVRKTKADLGNFRTGVSNDLNAVRGIGSSGGHGIGAAIKSGTLAGVSGLAGALSFEVAAAVRAAIAAGRAAARAKSPSRETMKLGKDMADGAAIGFRKHGGNLAKEARFQVAKTIEGMRKQLKKYEKLLADAQNRLDRIKSARSDLESNIRSSINTYGTIGAGGMPTDVFGNEEAPTATGISAELQRRLSIIRQFGKNTRALLKMGYSDRVYKQIMAMGPEMGNEYAKALLQATPAEMKSINKATKDVAAFADQTASFAGREMFAAGQKVAAGVVAGLKKKRNAIAKALEQAQKAAERRRDAAEEARKKREDARGGDGSGSKRSGDGRRRSNDRVVHRKTINNRITVNTREIDPRRHAAQLGWELGSRQ